MSHLRVKRPCNVSNVLFVLVALCDSLSHDTPGAHRIFLVEQQQQLKRPILIMCFDPEAVALQVNCLVTRAPGIAIKIENFEA